MKNQSKGLLTTLGLGLCSVFFLLLRYAVVSPIIGSSFSFFSFSDLVMPLSGNFGFGFVGLLVGLRLALRYFFLGAPMLAAVYHIPGVCAAAYWTTTNKIISLLIPLACMIAFLAHPIGWQAGLYSVYWLIPMALYFVPRKNILMHSFASTFIAHSVGSVIWLYLKPMPATAWLALIPLVALERCVFAMGMTALYYIGKKSIQTLSKTHTFRFVESTFS